MTWFIAAVYNEENEVEDLINHVLSLVNGIAIVDDGSSDRTFQKLHELNREQTNGKWWLFKSIAHTGLPETVKNEALKMVPDGNWVLMLDADERLTDYTKEHIKTFFEGEHEQWDYVYFNQQEIIDGVHVRTFQKCKLFRKEAIRFPLDNIHADDVFEGRGTYKENWVVLHRKTTYKQIKREEEYLATYKKLLDEGKIDQGRYDWLVGLHHFVRPS